ncbi:hypothetical protein CC2G_001497 [Coprinopsis cinerea AmutBmut pab1-1]|nr:hypothetical protein CC2G_001497 [Coprinopsis cinerea AmutBmut pab1-1]
MDIRDGVGKAKDTKRSGAGASLTLTTIFASNRLPVPLAELLWCGLWTPSYTYLLSIGLACNLILSFLLPRLCSTTPLIACLITPRRKHLVLSFQTLAAYIQGRCLQEIDVHSSASPLMDLVSERVLRLELQPSLQEGCNPD